MVTAPTREERDERGGILDPGAHLDGDGDGRHACDCDRDLRDLDSAPT
jgi:hypothetical protein